MVSCEKPLASMLAFSRLCLSGLDFDTRSGGADRSGTAVCRVNPSFRLRADPMSALRLGAPTAPDRAKTLRKGMCEQAGVAQR